MSSVLRCVVFAPLYRAGLHLTAFIICNVLKHGKFLQGKDVGARADFAGPSATVTEQYKNLTRLNI